MPLVRWLTRRVRRLMPEHVIATPWHEWRVPALFLAARVAGGILGGIGLPFPIDWLVGAGSHLAGFAFLVASGVVLFRAVWVGGRRDRLIMRLAGQGDAASLSTVIRLLDAEIRSRPAALRPHLVEPMERLRGYLARRLLERDPLERGMPRSVRRWLFGATPAGPFPEYAQSLVSLAEEDPASFHLPALRDLRDPGAHLIAGPADRVLQARANRVIDRILARRRDLEPDSSPDAVLDLVDEMHRSRVTDALRAEQDLRHLGPAAVSVLAGVPVRRKWWWSAKAWAMPACALGLYSMARNRVVPDLGPLELLVRELAERVPWLVAFGARFVPRDAVIPYLGVLAAFLVAGWAADIALARQRGRMRRTARRTAAALTLIDGPEAADALLAVERAREAYDADVARRLRSRARLARRLVALPANEAADAIVPYGGWLFKSPGEGGLRSEWAEATLALIRHAWPPAAVPLLQSWARGAVEGLDAQVVVSLSEAGLHTGVMPHQAASFRERATATLAELEERMATQGALLRPAAPPRAETLLRPASVAPTPAANLVQPADASSAAVVDAAGHAAPAVEPAGLELRAEAD